jgi:hypothetical protein
MSLSAGEPTSLRIWRMAQQDLSMIVRFRAAPPNAKAIADQVLADSKKSPSVWKYLFASPVELHAFQKFLTGADVLFDGVASSFTATRGSGLRTKKEEFGIARIQLLHDGWKQLWEVLTYFEDGQAMNFALEANDVFERYNGKNKYSIRLVEAKVKLPAEGDDQDRRGFLCPEDITEAEERDDITLTFESESVRDQLAQVLPSSVKRTTTLMGALHLR